MSARKRNLRRTGTPNPPNRSGSRSDRGGAASARRISWLTVGVASAVAAALVALVVVSATRSTSKSASGAAVAAPSRGGDPGGRVSRLALTSLDGQRVSLPVPGRPGALFFSVSSCSSCIPSAQALSTLKSRLAGVDALMVDLDPRDSPQYLREWGQAVGDPSFPLAIDTTGNMVNYYRVQALGTTVIYDAKGRIVDRLIEPSMGELENGFRKAGAA